jgi:hypothetical protein
MADENILDLSTNAKKRAAAEDGLYFPGNKAVEYIQKQMPRNPAAVQDVLGLRQQLTEAQKFVIRKEGLVTVPYYATKDEKDNNIVTEGVGGVDTFRPKRGETFAQAFLRAYADKEATARRLFDNYDTFDPKLQTQIMSGVYRGDFKKEHNTVKAINKGDFRTASEQFLNREDYKSWTENKKSRRKNQGLINRLEAIQKALETEFIRRANVPEFAEERPSSSGQASQTADQIRTERAANLLAGQPPEPEPNLQPDIPVNQLFQKGGTPMASEQENDEMIQIGLVQDPNDTDPVSGNEIPLGATAEGVRDDEVAAISPGEFVVPQYAVNYHGLDFYMDSLNTAKQGLRQMDRMGMTGRPDEATLPDDMALPTMEEETTPILDRPIDTEMFMRGGLQTPVHSFANGGLVQYQTGGTYTTPTGLNVPTPTVATPTVQTPTAAPGAQVAAAPQQPGQMFYSPMPATPMPMQMPAVPQVQPGAPTISYTGYQGITGGQFGGYKLQEYKHKDTGNSIFLTLVGGKLPPGVTVPPGYIPVEEYNQQQAQEPAPTTPTVPTIDRGGPPTAFDLEMEQQQFEEEQAGQLQEKIDARKDAIANALAIGTAPAPAEDAAEGAYEVDSEHGMFIDGKFVTDARVLQQYADSTRRSIYTEEHPLGRFGAAVGRYIEKTPTMQVVQAIAQAGKDLLDGVFDRDEEDDTKVTDPAATKAFLRRQIQRDEEADAAEAGFPYFQATSAANLETDDGEDPPGSGSFAARQRRTIENVQRQRAAMAREQAAKQRQDVDAATDAAAAAGQRSPADAERQRVMDDRRAATLARAEEQRANRVMEDRRADTMARAAEQRAERERDRREMEARRASPYDFAAGGLVKKKNKRRNGKGLAKR